MAVRPKVIIGVDEGVAVGRGVIVGVEVEAGHGVEVALGARVGHGVDVATS